jgi:signal transduction histidine kinase/HAMP domain-containing protein
LGFLKGGLRTKIITWSFVPTAIILVTVALVTFTAYQRVTEDLVIERDQELTRLSASRLATELAEYTGILASSARTTGTYIHPAVQRITLQRASERLTVFDGGVLVLDAFGTVVAAKPERPEALGQNWSDRPYFSQTMHAREPIYSSILPDGPGNAQVIVIAVPIIGPQDEFLGIVAGMLRLGTETAAAFFGDVVKPQFGEKGSAYLVDGNGRVIYHSDTRRIGAEFSEQAVVREALDGRVGAIRTRDPEGQDIVAGFAPVPGTPWGLVTEESWAALISPGRNYRQFLLLLLALGVLIPALVVAIAASRITSPIRELIGAAQAVAGGDFEQRIKADTGDEVEELAEQFSLMSAQLQESYTNLERRVVDRTRELAALNAIAAVVSRSLDLQETLNDALGKTLEVMEIEAGGIYLLDETTGELTIAAQRGFDPQFVAEVDHLKVGEGFSGQVVQTGQPLVVGDISTDPRLTRTRARENGFRSLASVPLSSKGKMLGTLFAGTRDYREFTDEDVQLLTSIGNQIGVAIDNARLFESERQRRQEATLLAEVAKLISGTLDLDEVLRLTAECAVEVFEVDCCCLFEYDEEEGTLRPAVQIEADGSTLDHEPPAEAAQVSPESSDVEFTPSPRMRQIVLESLQPLMVEDVPSDPHLSPQHPLDLQSALLAPIEVGGRRLGAMQLGTRPPRRRRFTAEEAELALAMANQAAVAIDSARLFEDEQRRAEQFWVIGEVGRRITSILAVDELLDQMVRLIQEAFNYYLVEIGLVEENHVVFKARAGRNQGSRFESFRLKVGEEGITGWVAAAGEPLLVPDVRQEPRYVKITDTQTRSGVAVPIMIKDEVTGVINVESDQLEAFDASDVAVLQSLGHQAAIAIQNAQLYEQAQQVATLEERQRLARELHDSVTQALYGVTLYAEAAARLLSAGDAELASNHLREVRQTAQEALREMRLLIFELRPPVLEEEGLVAALETRLEAVEGRSGLETDFILEGDIRLPTDVEEGLYRIAQEALNNALKHAQAKCIAVKLRQEAQAVTLEVNDDGIGFDPSTAREQGGLGLPGMEERAVGLGGRLAVNSRPGKGTSVKVEVDL